MTKRRLPLHLKLTQWNTKVSEEALVHIKAVHARMRDRNGARLSDVLSTALLMLDEEALAAELDALMKVEEETPKALKTLIKDLDSLSDEDRELVRKLVS